MTCEEDTIPTDSRSFQQSVAERNDFAAGGNLRNNAHLHVIDDEGTSRWCANIHELIRDRESVSFSHCPPLRRRACDQTADSGQSPFGKELRLAEEPAGR